MAYEDRYTELEQYLASGEPGVEKCALNWSMATGFIVTYFLIVLLVNFMSIWCTASWG